MHSYVDVEQRWEVAQLSQLPEVLIMGNGMTVCFYVVTLSFTTSLYKQAICIMFSSLNMARHS